MAAKLPCSITFLKLSKIKMVRSSRKCDNSNVLKLWSFWILFHRPVFLSRLQIQTDSKSNTFYATSQIKTNSKSFKSRGKYSKRVKNLASWKVLLIKGYPKQNLASIDTIVLFEGGSKWHSITQPFILESKRIKIATTWTSRTWHRSTTLLDLK